MKGLLVVLCVATVHVCLGQTGDRCSVQDPETREHETKDGSIKCCIPRPCSIGTYPVVCSGGSRDIVCRDCPENTFMPHSTMSYNHVHNCLAKKDCSTTGLTAVDDGSRDHDRRCVCDLEAGFYDYDYGEESTTDESPHYCVGKECPAGKELHVNGSCVKCHIGTFKATGGYERCKPWTDCENSGKKLLYHGTILNDTKCIPRPVVLTTTTPRTGETKDRNGDEEGGAPFEIIFGILGGIIFLVIVFTVLLCRINKCKFPHGDKDSEKQSFKGREDVASTVSSVPPSSKSPLSLDITRANRSFNKKRHGSSPDSGIADMKGYAPCFPPSEKPSNQINGPSFQYARDIQEDGGSLGDDHNTSFQGETIPEEETPDDCKSVDSAPPIVNHYYYFPQHGNVNLQMGKDNKMYAGGAPADTPPTPEDVCAGVHGSNYNATKHTVV